MKEFISLKSFKSIDYLFFDTIKGYGKGKAICEPKKLTVSKEAVISVREYDYVGKACINIAPIKMLEGVLKQPAMTNYKSFDCWVNGEKATLPLVEIVLKGGSKFLVFGKYDEFIQCLEDPNCESFPVATYEQE